MILMAESFLTLLSAGLLAMALLAAFYLRSRKLSFDQYICWGLLVILIPLLGPFLTILSQPGEPRR